MDYLTGAKLRTQPLLKLVSPKGTLLGHITCPGHWIDYLKKNGNVQFAIMPRLKGFVTLHEFDAEPVAARTGALSVDYRGGFDSGVRLHGISIEEFENMPECSFSPSAGYLRSVLNES